MSTAQLPFTLRDTVEWLRPRHVGMIAVLVATAFVAFGLVPGVVTATWLALTTAVLTRVDVRLHRLPNVLVLPGFATLGIDLGWHWAVRGSAPMAALVTVVIVAALLFGASCLGALGMGDVKLTVVLAGCLGLASPALAAAAFAIALLAGGGVSAVLLLRGHADRKQRIPFGPFLLAGFWAVALLLVGARLT